MTGEHVSGGASSRGAPSGEARPATTGAPPGSVLPVADRPPEVGDVLDGRYGLVDLLGRGGFGDVWRADELLPDGTPFRQVALKLLAPHVTDAASWVEEAKLLASFRHPSLVTIFATGVFHGAWPQPFVAMELLEGSTLADVLTERGPVPWRRVLAWAREAAAALDVIHAHGVVHLDLKPANLFLCKDGTIKVLDFGIARRSTPPAGKGREDAFTPASARADEASRQVVLRAGGGATGEAPDSMVLPRSSVPALSERDAQMSTAVFAAEQGLGVGGQATGGEAAAPRRRRRRSPRRRPSRRRSRWGRRTSSGPRGTRPAPPRGRSSGRPGSWRRRSSSRSSLPPRPTPTHWLYAWRCSRRGSCRSTCPTSRRAAGRTRPR